MDHPVHGVQATVIDLGLSRMDACGDGGSTEIRWTPFDEEIFEGEGQQVAFDWLGPFTHLYSRRLSVRHISPHAQT
jgi:hypothetical protein